MVNQTQASADFISHKFAKWYLSPEIILKSSIYPSKLDIWSLGCIFAELMYTFQPGNDDR